MISLNTNQKERELIFKKIDREKVIESDRSVTAVQRSMYASKRTSLYQIFTQQHLKRRFVLLEISIDVVSIDFTYGRKLLIFCCDRAAYGIPLLLHKQFKKGCLE